MNEELLALLESEDVEDNMAALRLFEATHDAYYEDSDPEDGVSDSEVEAIKRRKEKQKKIVKIIAICTAGIALCAAVTVTVIKLKKKGEIGDSEANRVTKKAKDSKGWFSNLSDKMKGFLKKKTLTEAEASFIDAAEAEAEERQQWLDEANSGISSDSHEYRNVAKKSFGGKVVQGIKRSFRPAPNSERTAGGGRPRKIVSAGKPNTADQIPIDNAELKAAIKNGLDVGVNDYVVMLNSGDTYDRVVDAILEKYNTDIIDAETCLALMERAAERYGENDYDIDE